MTDPTQANGWPGELINDLCAMVEWGRRVSDINIKRTAKRVLQHIEITPPSAAPATGDGVALANRWDADADCSGPLRSGVLKLCATELRVLAATPTPAPSTPPDVVEAAYRAGHKDGWIARDGYRHALENEAANENWLTYTARQSPAPDRGAEPVATIRKSRIVPRPIMTRWQPANVLFDPAIEKPVASCLEGVDCQLIWIARDDWSALQDWRRHPPQPRASDRALRAALDGLLDHVDRNTCEHEDTHRGGAIWTICDGCGRKWADDEGGFKPYEDAPAVAAARTALAGSPDAADDAERRVRELEAAFKNGFNSRKHSDKTGNKSADQAWWASSIRRFALSPAGGSAQGGKIDV